MNELTAIGRVRGRQRPWRPRLARLLPALLAVGLLAAGCAAPPQAQTQATQSTTVEVTIRVDGETRLHNLPAGLTVREALAHAGIALNELDRLTPPPFTIISPALAIAVTRISESFETEQVIVPFQTEVVRNEGLPEGERRLLQVGANGVEEITYRTVLEDGSQVSRSIVRRVTLTPPAAEIIMVGSQGIFTPVPISGTLAYMNGRNAWIMRNNSGQRIPLTTGGDLDGHVFELSPDGQWILATRGVTQPNSPAFNTLWVIPTGAASGSAVTTTRPLSAPQSAAIGLPITNVLYAEWSPIEPRTILYSTADRIARAPGWQANNNLLLLTWPQTPTVRTVYSPTVLLDSSAGGAYGWWGTGYAIAPDGQSIAYARADSIGIVAWDVVQTRPLSITVSQSELAQFTAYNTHSDWAWYPAMSWSPDGRFLYTVTHGPPLGLEAPEDSPVFDFTALEVESGLQFRLVPRAGMFTNPTTSPVQAAETGEAPFRVAFMQAVEPNNSPFSAYRLGIIDRDGSNLRTIFPPPDQPGLPANERVAWSPDGRLLAVALQGNLWLLEPDTDLAQQLTGDGLAGLPQWGP